MDTQFILNLISRWLHIIPAIIMVGGTLFIRLALIPASEKGEINADSREAVRRNWAKWIAICTLLLLVSGFYNAYVKASSLQLSGAYVGLLLVKMLLAFGVFYLAARLAGKSAKAIEMRTQEKKWTNMLCLLMLAIVVIAGWMKTASGSFDAKPPKAPVAIVAQPQ